MNQQQAQALYDAEQRGVKQIIGRLRDEEGGRCAMGVLMDAGWSSKDLASPMASCPLCGATEHTFWEGTPLWNEQKVIVHLNNDHRLTFAEIARKLGPDSI